MSSERIKVCVCVCATNIYFRDIILHRALSHIGKFWSLYNKKKFLYNHDAQKRWFLILFVCSFLIRGSLDPNSCKKI